MAIKVDLDESNEGGAFIFEEGKPAYVVTIKDLPEEMLRRVALFGLIEKLRNSYARAADAVKNGEAATVVEYARDCVESMYENLCNGVYSDRSGSKGPRIGDLAQALQAARPSKFPDRATAIAFLKRQDEAGLDRLRDGLAEHLAVIAEERARKRKEAAKAKAATVDLDSLID